MHAEHATTSPLDAEKRLTPLRLATGAGESLLHDGLRLAIVLALGLILLLALAFAPASGVRGSMAEVAPAQMAAIQARWGIRITNVAVTAGGGFVDVRFQVVDPERAHTVMDAASRFALIDRASGAIVDKGGSHGHSDSMKAGGIYYMLYQNPGGVLKPGSAVSIRIGDSLLENVIVQ